MLDIARESFVEHDRVLQPTSPSKATRLPVADTTTASSGAGDLNDHAVANGSQTDASTSKQNMARERLVAQARALKLEQERRHNLLK